MPYIVPLDKVKTDFPQYEVVSALTPSEQKAAFHVRDNEGIDYCLKLISPKYGIDRLNREILALQSINHPNVARLVEYTFSSTKEEQRHYMIEEFIEGDDLASEYAAGKPWEIKRSIDVINGICEGLAQIHGINVVHRDLKPSNIRLRPDDTPVIIDFGLARHLDLPDLTKTSVGAGIGTPNYFAPEQFQDTKREIDRRTDLFALGILLFQSLTGNHPFAENCSSYAELQDNVCTSEEHYKSPAFTGLPSQIKILIRKLLAKDRIHRPFEATQVSSILANIGEQV